MTQVLNLANYGTPFTTKNGYPAKPTLGKKGFWERAEEEILAIENRLKEIDQARNYFIGLIASGACDEDKLDGEFAKLYAEEQSLSERLLTLKAHNKTSAETQQKLDKIMDIIEHEKFELEVFDNVLIRKLIECVKVMSKNEVTVIFKGGYEVKAEIE